MVRIAGKAKVEVKIKKILQPIFGSESNIKKSATYPEKPPSNLPGNIMIDVNKAYWTAVNSLDTKLVKNVILTVATSPAAKLSSPTIVANKKIFFPESAATLKNIFVIKTNIPPKMSERFISKILIMNPPIKNPKIDITRATVLTRDPISIFEYPISK